MGRDENFPFGRAQMEPMVIVVQSIALIIICIKAFSGAVISLFSGGQEINNLSGMGYAAIGAIGCFIGWYYIVYAGRKNAPKSELIRTQGAQWLMDSILSLAVLVGFFISYIMQHAGYGNYALYMDPLMVIVSVLFFIREPIISLINGTRGMLIMMPEKAVYSVSKEAVEEIAKQRGFEDTILRLGKSGRELVYEISFVADDPASSCSVGQMDEIHREVEQKLQQLFDSQLWLRVSFVHDKNLA